MTDRRTLIIGVDGAEPTLLNKWAEAGELPHFHELITCGASGPLESTVPPLTCPAWNCMVTGRNPGKVGLYDWLVFPFNAEAGARVVNLRHQEAPGFWTDLNAHGKRAGVVNLPTAYPPEPVDGFFVSGNLTPPGSANYTHPRSLAGELDAATDGYEIVPFMEADATRNPRRALQEIRAVVDKRTRALEHLATNKPWDVLMGVYFLTDTVQHYYWHHMDADHPRHRAEAQPEFEDAILSVYKQVDAGLGRIRDAVPDDTNIVVASDHGFGPMEGYFYVNRWLADEGFLAADAPESPGLIQRALERTRDAAFSAFDPDTLQGLARKLPTPILEALMKRLSYTGGLRQQGLATLDRIRWGETQAYGLGTIGTIFLNVEGRDPHGVVSREDYDAVRDDLAQRLERLRGPTGKRLGVTVHRKEEVYHGPHVDRAPDLIYDLDGGRYIQKADLGPHVWGPSPMSGWHRQQGVLLAAGPDIRTDGATVRDATIYDVAPTVLHLAGVPTPEDMDGRVLSDLFRQGGNAHRRAPSRDDGAKAQEMDRVRQRLRSLKGKSL